MLYADALTLALVDVETFQQYLNTMVFHVPQVGLDRKKKKKSKKKKKKKNEQAEPSNCFRPHGHILL